MGNDKALFFFSFFFSLAPENCTNGNLEYTPHHLYSYMRGQKKDKRQRHGDVSYLQPIKNTWFLAGLNAVPCDNLLLFFFLRFTAASVPQGASVWSTEQQSKGPERSSHLTYTHTHFSYIHTHTHTALEYEYRGPDRKWMWSKLSSITRARWGQSSHQP